MKLIQRVTKKCKKKHAQFHIIARVDHQLKLIKLHETHLENYQEMQKDTVSILLNFLRKHVLYL